MLQLISREYSIPRPFGPGMLAVISGAGISGLAASLELRRRGFRVLIVESRGEFNRWNVINLSAEVEAFFKRFSLLEAFKREVAARITEHKYLLIDQKGEPQSIGLSDVRRVTQDPSIPVTAKEAHRLFHQDGIYSMSIGDLQSFLAKCALEAGVSILGNTTVDGLTDSEGRGIRTSSGRTLKPDLFFIGEGARSTTSSQVGIRRRRVINACTDERWIFGNATYAGRETFVISVIDVSQSVLRIANLIFNAKRGVVNEDHIRGSKRAAQNFEKASQSFKWCAILT